MRSAQLFARLQDTGLAQSDSLELWLQWRMHCFVNAQAYLLFQALECLLHMLRAVALLQELLFQLLACVWP